MSASVDFRDIMEPRRTESGIFSFMTRSWKPQSTQTLDKYLSPQEMKDIVANSVYLEAVVESESTRTGVRKDKLRKEIASYLEEMGFEKSMHTIRWMGVVFLKISFMMKIKLYVNEPAVLKLKATMGSNPVMFLPTHRSYADFCLMTYLCYHYDIDFPTVAAGMACHLILYSLAAIFGLMNFVFIQNTMHLVDENCVLFPRVLAFHMVELPVDANGDLNSAQRNELTDISQDIDAPTNDTSDAAKVKRDANVATEGILKDLNGSVVTENTTHRLFLDTSRTLFEMDQQCQFAEFMPIMSTIFAAVWLTMFTMCPGGGHARVGLQQPWRILMPALVFALVVVGLTGSSFTITNKGLHAFCEAFSEVTNTTTCSAVNPHLELGWNATWGFGGRVAATKAASAGVLAAWTCAAALLIVRCLAAPDFVVKRTGVYLAKDPHQKITPHLRVKSPRSPRSPNSSPTKRDTQSVKSEPTAVTELVSASVEPGRDSAPSSLLSTPAHLPRNSDHIELTCDTQERFLNQP